jgi:myo-inositol-1(or 4)-monophosphatase
LRPVSHEDSVVAAFREAACGAGLVALAYFRTGAATAARIFRKAGGSPVTEADYLVDQFLAKRLKPLLPQAGWLSEESKDCLARLSREQLVVVDPIDGTRAFMSGHKGWSIAVALVENGRPLLGVVHAPALGETYVAVEGAGARLNGKPITVSQRAAGGAIAKIAAPKLLAEQLRQEGLDFELQPRIPSLALRIVNVASGALDAAFASANARDWDIAAADVILREAGGQLATLEGSEIFYNRKETSHGPLIAAPEPIHAGATAAARHAHGKL